MRQTSIAIIVPAYNEADGAAQTVADLRPIVKQLQQDFVVEVLFVNDGSRDNTEEILLDTIGADPTMRVVSHEINRGLGAAIRTGFQNIDKDIVVTTDFDGTYRFDTIPAIINMLIERNADVVTASPYHKDGLVIDVPSYRLVFSYGASLLYRLLVSNRISTWTALFRAYRFPVTRQVTFQSNDFLAGTEILVRAVQQGFKVEEYPTNLHSRAFGQSSIKIAKVTMAHLKFQMKLLGEAFGLNRLTGNTKPKVSEADKYL